MSKKHLKRLNTPKTWNINKKENVYIKRPNPGAHSFSQGMSLNTFLKDLLKIAKTSKEVKNILNKNEVMIDGIRRKEPKFIVGFMDVVTIPLLKESFRVILNRKGKLDVVKISESESKLKPCKIIGKAMYKNKLQINLSDGRNILGKSKECKIGDSVLIEVPNQEIKNVMPLERGALVILIGGNKTGAITTVEEINGSVMRCRSENSVFETVKMYAFVIGKEKPVVKIE